MMRRTRVAIVLPSVLPNSPLFFLCLRVHTLCEQTAQSGGWREGSKRVSWILVRNTCASQEASLEGRKLSGDICVA